MSARDELVAEIAAAVRGRWFPDADSSADDEGLFVDMARTAVEAVESRGYRPEADVLVRFADHLDRLIHVGGSPGLDVRLAELVMWLRGFVSRGGSLFRDGGVS